jgi:transcriptional regulator with XRE-family HTH domain
VPRLALVLTSIAANVRRLRARKGWTQEGLAEKTGLHLTYIQAIERGTKNISVGVLLQLSDALDAPVPVLLRPAKLAPPRAGRPRKKQTRAR